MVTCIRLVPLVAAGAQARSAAVAAARRGVQVRYLDGRLVLSPLGVARTVARTLCVRHQLCLFMNGFVGSGLDGVVRRGCVAFQQAH